jgi:hypothetical protein
MKMDKDTKRVLQGGCVAVLGAVLIGAADAVMTFAPIWKDSAYWVMKFGLLPLFIGIGIVYSTPMPSRK